VKFKCTNCTSKFEPDREFYSWAGKRGEDYPNRCPFCQKDTAIRDVGVKKIELLPCRCGGKGIIPSGISFYAATGRTFYKVRCRKCKREILGDTKQQAKENWNKLKEAQNG